MAARAENCKSRYTRNTTGIYWVDATGFNHLSGTYQIELRDAGVGSAATHFQNITSELNNFSVNAGGWTDQNHYPRALADVDGDGLADIVGFANGARWSRARPMTVTLRSPPRRLAILVLALAAGPTRTTIHACSASRQW